jgi:hypothetical protein
VIATAIAPKRFTYYSFLEAQAALAAPWRVHFCEMTALSRINIGTIR